MSCLFLRTLSPAILALSVLSGCKPGPQAGSQDNSFQAKAHAAIEAAKLVEDPWLAREQLNNQIKNIEADIAKAELPRPTAEDANPIWLEFQRYEALAIRQGNPLAIDWAARHDLARHAPAILSAAERARGAPADRSNLRVAGELLLAGAHVQRDTSRGVGYLARAWAAGEPEAASAIAKHFLALNDFRNAYLWSIRCVTPCQRSFASPDVRLESLQARLSPEAARQAETLANDPAIVEIDLQLEVSP